MVQAPQKAQFSSFSLDFSKTFPAIKKKKQLYFILLPFALSAFVPVSSGPTDPYRHQNGKALNRLFAKAQTTHKKTVSKNIFYQMFYEFTHNPDVKRFFDFLIFGIFLPVSSGPVDL